MKSGFMLLVRQSLIIVNVAIHCKRSPPLGYRVHVFSPSVQNDSWILCSSVPRHLSLTLAKISEARWSDNDLQSVIERCGTQLRASSSQVFIDLICPLISARAPRSLSPVSSPCCSAYLSAWRMLRHTHTHTSYCRGAKGQRHDSVPVAVAVFDLREVSEKVTSSLLGFVVLLIGERRICDVITPTSSHLRCPRGKRSFTWSPLCAN